MKKTFFAITAAILLMFGVSSCTNCATCTKATKNDVKVCEQNYNSTAEFNASVNEYTNQGYNCSKRSKDAFLL